MQIFKQNKSRFRIVIHDLKTKKTKTLSLVDGELGLTEIREKIKKSFEGN